MSNDKGGSLGLMWEAICWMPDLGHSRADTGGRPVHWWKNIGRRTQDQGHKWEDSCEGTEV